MSILSQIKQNFDTFLSISFNQSVRSVPNKIHQGHTLGTPKRGTHLIQKKGTYLIIFLHKKGDTPWGSQKRDTPHFIINGGTDFELNEVSLPMEVCPFFHNIDYCIVKTFRKY